MIQKIGKFVVPDALKDPVEEVKRLVETAFPWVNPGKEWTAWVNDPPPDPDCHAVMQVTLGPSTLLGMFVWPDASTMELTTPGRSAFGVQEAKVPAAELPAALGYLKQEWARLFAAGDDRFKLAVVGNTVELDDHWRGRLQVRAGSRVVLSPTRNAFRVVSKDRPAMALRAFGKLEEVGLVWIAPTDVVAFKAVRDRWSPLKDLKTEPVIDNTPVLGQAQGGGTP